MNFLERFFPGLALRRVRSRIILDELKRSYDAAKTSPHRKRPTVEQSGDAAVQQAGIKLRLWARHLDENHDLAIGALDTLVNNIVGTGLTAEPMVTTTNGGPADRVNRQLREAWKQWIETPEVTGEYAFSEVQRLVCRSWLRDGEVLAQHVEGEGRIKHLGGVPYSLELIEADYLPLDYFNAKTGIIHGVEKDAWGRPRAYHLYLEHPGNASVGFYLPSDRNTKRVSADQIVHLKFTRRLKQTRGVSVFHGVITRLDDLKDYEESERIAARVAAAFTGYIKKSPDLASTLNAEGDRTFEMNPGMIFDNLLPGEEVGTVASNRPNTALGDFRNAMMRAIASGVGASYSSISKDYSGTYSAQRQEMVEASPAYRRMREYFIASFMRPVYQRFVDMAVLSGAVTVPRGIDARALYAVDFGGVASPWIDPKKEIEADKLAVEAGFKSRHLVIRERGYDPRVIDEQREADDQAPEPLPNPLDLAPPSPADDEPDDDDQDGEGEGVAA